MQFCKRVVSRGFISTTKYKMQKSEMFFCILSSTDDKTIAKGGLQSCQVGLDDKMKKKQKRRNAPKLAPKRDAKLDAARRNRDVTGPACHVDHVITRRSGRNSANCRSGR